MKVLMLAQFFPPDVGGEERHVLNLSQALAARGHQVAVATHLVPGTMPYEAVDSGVAIHRFATTAMRVPGAYSDPARPHHPPIPDPNLTIQLSRLIDRERPDVVHAHNWIVNSAVAVPRYSGRHKFGLVLTMHDYSTICATKRMMLNGGPCSGPRLPKCLACSVQQYGLVVGSLTAMATPVMRRWKGTVLDHVICVSRSVADRNDVSSWSIPFSIIPNFIPDDLVAERNNTDGQLTSGVGQDFVFFAGDLTRDKGCDVLLEAWAAIGPERPLLVMVGRRHLDTPRTVPPDVCIAEKWPHDAVLSAFRRCRLAVLPSTWPDPCPTTVLEAMAAGCPVITTSTGGMVDMIEDGVSGILVRPGDSGALATAMRRILADESMRDVLGKAARQRARLFTASAVCERIERVYEAVAP